MTMIAALTNIVVSYSTAGSSSLIYSLSPTSSPLSSPQLTVKFRKASSPVTRTGVHFNAKEPDGAVSVPLISMDPAATTKSIFHVTGMSCSSCVAKIEREVSKRSGKRYFSFDPMFKLHLHWVAEFEYYCIILYLFT